MSNRAISTELIELGERIRKRRQEMKLSQESFAEKAGISAELKATYQEIKDYVLKEFGLKVSSLYISQVKRKCGIEVGENYNLPKSENARVPQCPKEKEDAIKAALKYFAMI